MTKPERLAFQTCCAAAGALIGTVAIMGFDGSADGPASPRERPAGFQNRASAPSVRLNHKITKVAARRTLLLAWATGGVPGATERVLKRTPGVIDATTVEAGLDWIESSHNADGTAVDEPPRGTAIPFELAYVEPGEYANFVPPAERDVVRALNPGEAILATTEADLRGAGEGLRMKLRDRSLQVSGIASDIATGGYEALTTGALPRSWTRVDRFVLIHLQPAVDRERVVRAIEPLLAPDQRLRVRAQGETPFLRYGDAVLPQLLIKETFGEFSAKPLPDGRVDIADAWQRENIRTGRVPLLGQVLCHRAMLPQLRNALKEVVAQGLAHTINRSQYGGCFGPRFVNSDPRGRLSHHAWGVAIDINVAENAYGTRPDQDTRLVEVFKQEGFTWGGDWQIPDGMHFEWVRFP
jgi:D-alanyl-D-alanine carboxypeptidase